MLRTLTTCLATSLALLSLAAPASAHGTFEHAQEAERAHNFGLAEQHLRALVQEEPHNAQAWLSLASLETVRGNIDAAREACAEATRQLDAIVSLACRGRIALAGAGDKRRALAALKPLLEHPAFVKRRDSLALWTLGVAAELSAAVDVPEKTEQLFQRALIDEPPVYLKAAYLDHLLSTKQADEALRYLDSQPPALALEVRRAIALLALDERSELQQVIDHLHPTFLRWMQALDYTHGREMAMFYLDVLPRPGLAARAATENLKYQREPEDLALYARVVSSSD